MREFPHKIDIKMIGFLVFTYFLQYESAILDCREIININRKLNIKNILL